MRDGPALAHLAEPVDGTGAPVLVIHSWWGLTAAFTDFADRLARAGFLVACVDLYSGELPSTGLEARRLRRAPRPEPMYRTLQRAIHELADNPLAASAAPAVIGFSMGGHWAVWLAQHPPPTVSAVVLYYCARSGDFTRTGAPFLAHFAEDDDFVTTAARRNMERGLARQAVPYEAHDYPGTGHWFAESTDAAHDPAAAAAAFGRTVAFLRSSTES